MVETPESSTPEDPKDAPASTESAPRYSTSNKYSPLKSMLLGATLATAILAGGYAAIKTGNKPTNINPNPSVQSEPYLPVNIKGTKTSSKKINKNTGLEAVILRDHKYYLMTNTQKQEGELDFILYDAKNTDRVIKGNEVVPETTEVQIPTLYAKDGKKQTTVTLSPLEKEIQEPDYKNSNVIKDTLPYELHLSTRIINGTEYFTPERSSEDTVGVYFVKVDNKTTKPIVHPDGRISLRSEEGVYIPVKISSETYSNRSKPKELPPEPQSQSGTAISTSPSK